MHLMHWCSYLACASHKSALYRPKFKADTSLYFLHRVPSWQFSVISFKSEKWIWVVVLWFKEITGFWAANYGRDRCTTGYRKTANHKLVIKMHTVRGSTASERNPVEMVKILKTEFGHIAYNLDRKIMDEISIEVGEKNRCLYKN